MKEFSNLFIVYMVSDIQKIENNQVILRAGCKGIRMDSDDFYFETSSETKDAGKLYGIEATVVIEKVSSLIARQFRTERSVVIEVHSSNSNEDVFIIGSMDYPAKATITTQLQKDQLKISSKSLQSPL
jgi:hypothetical protein